eukprot:TRINITY_DN2587_c0_g1_i1.p1 TRINITY_DN2587_c0_g1~~TRINITY_DN2587_c0_g1_i1.p1  ORF type:complete len:343 (+),score=56.61 TRINITY_DN2587_c0_g1_i1:29-1057(+)
MSNWNNNNFENRNNNFGTSYQQPQQQHQPYQHQQQPQQQPHQSYQQHQQQHQQHHHQQQSQQFGHSYNQQASQPTNNQPQTGGASSSSAAQQAPYTRPPGSDQSIRPVTIRMIFNAEQDGDGFRIDDRPVFQVSIMGLIEKRTDTQQSMTLQLNDSTGTIESTLWYDTDITILQPTLDSAQESHYVRVIGQIKHMGGRLQLLATRVIPTIRHSELTYHFLDVINSHLCNTSGPIPPANQPPLADEIPKQAALLAQEQEQQAPQEAQQLNDVHTAIMQLVTKSGPETVTPKDEILKALGASWDNQTVWQHIEDLLQGQMLQTAGDANNVIADEHTCAQWGYGT